MERIKDEQNARYFYESAAAWCRDNGYSKAEAYYKAEAESEKEHYYKILNFLKDWNVDIVLPAIETPISQFLSLDDIILKQLEIEQELLNKYEADATDILPISNLCHKFVTEFVEIQGDSVVEAYNLVTKMFNYKAIDPQLVLFEQHNF